MSQSPFQKFTVKKKNSVVKEQIRQEKKKARAEKNAYFDNLKEEKYQAMLAKRAQKAAGGTGAVIPAAPPVPKTNKKGPDAKKAPEPRTTEEAMPLNKFLAHCGVCSRREAVKVVTDGKVKVKIDKGTQPGKVLRLRNKGLPDVNRYGTGDLLVNIGVYIPETLSSDEKKLIEKFEESTNFKPTATAKKNFFSHFKQMFG